MSKKLTVMVDHVVSKDLYSIIGPHSISQFLNDLARPNVLQRDLAEGYRTMAADLKREQEASEWVENLTGDIAHEPV